MGRVYRKSQLKGEKQIIIRIAFRRLSTKWLEDLVYASGNTMQGIKFGWTVLKALSKLGVTGFARRNW
jgi:phosphosulfolactate synthase (CoM biosynthesis protein A)